MPTYEYKCEQCGRFDYFQPITADPLEACPTCNNPVHRLISMNGNIIFKGSGWHITDYRSKSDKDKAKQEQGDNGSSDKAKKAESNTGSNGTANASNS